MKSKPVRILLQQFWRRGKFMVLAVLLILFSIAAIATKTVDVTSWILVEKQPKTHNNFILNPTREQVKVFTNKPVRAIKIYPNPVTDNLTLYFDKTLENATVQVYDGNGKLVFISEDQDGKTLNLDIADFSKGNYLINVADNQYNYYSTKFTRK